MDQENETLANGCRAQKSHSFGVAFCKRVTGLPFVSFGRVWNLLRLIQMILAGSPVSGRSKAGGSCQNLLVLFATDWPPTGSGTSLALWI